MIAYDRLPEHMREAARAYVEDGYPPGDFLRAVLENNFTGAVAKADGVNQNALVDWARWVHNDVPMNAWGSPERVKAWIATRDRERTEATA